MTDEARLAGIEYHGIPGTSRPCLQSLLGILQYGEQVTHARILTHNNSYTNSHCFLLTSIYEDVIAIKSGFGSGYSGEGEFCFSVALQLLHEHNVDIEEYIVEEAVIERLDHSALTQADLEDIDSCRPVRRKRIYDFIRRSHAEAGQDGTLWKQYRPIVPYAIIDSRIIDLAITFWDQPDDKINRGYRRLEDIVRERTGFKESSSKLFSSTFLGKNAFLHWPEVAEGERTGRGNLFTGAFSAHRNPRLHGELQHTSDELLSEFLILNHLYRLESTAVPNENYKEPVEPKPTQAAQKNATNA